MPFTQQGNRKDAALQGFQSSFLYLFQFLHPYLSVCNDKRDVDFSTHAFRQICFQMTGLYSRLERQDKLTTLFEIQNYLF